MEPQTQNIVETKPNNPLFQVTPHSKYLAIFLFIVLPFIGAWIGYQYALNNKVVTTETIPNTIISNTMQPELVASSSAVVSPAEVVSIGESINNYKNPEYGVEFSYPKTKIYLMTDPKVPNQVELYLNESMNDGEQAPSSVKALTYAPPEILMHRAYIIEIKALSDYVNKNVSAGYEYRYDSKTNSLVCMSRINSADGFNPCTELSDMEVGKTEAGSNIYMFESGDGGYATKSYVVALPSKNAIISFSTFKTEYYDGWLSGPELDNLIQVVLKSVK